MSKLIKCPKCGSKDIVGSIVLSPQVPVKLNWATKKEELTLGSPENPIKKVKTTRYIDVSVAFGRIKQRDFRPIDLIRDYADTVNDTPQLECKACKSCFATEDLELLQKTKESEKRKGKRARSYP